MPEISQPTSGVSSQNSSTRTVEGNTDSPTCLECSQPTRTEGTLAGLTKCQERMSTGCFWCCPVMSWGGTTPKSRPKDCFQDLLKHDFLWGLLAAWQREQRTLLARIKEKWSQLIWAEARDSWLRESAHLERVTGPMNKDWKHKPQVSPWLYATNIEAAANG